MNINYEERLNYIPEWILNKNLTNEERYAVSCSYAVSIIKETEKAILVKWNTDYGFITSWIPKSVLSDEAISKEMKQENNQLDSFLLGMDRHDELVKLGKSLNVKVRENSKIETIMKKFAEAGVAIPEYLRTATAYRNYRENI